MERQNILYRMVASIHCMQPVLSFFKHAIKKKTQDFFQEVCPVQYKFFMILYQQYIYEYIVSYEYCMLTSLTLSFSVSFTVV